MTWRLTLIVGFALAGPALAGDPTATKPVAPDENPLICKSEVVTGSIIPQRTCRTKRQWQQFNREVDRATDDALNAAHRKGIAPGNTLGQ